jgi:mannitol 2-dehydrogenase
VLCCDNIPDNTQAARTALVSFAALKNPALARWIDTYVAFPSTMVDRITPQTSEEEVEFVRKEFGIADKWPVLTEPYSQWVIEDNFCDGRPPLDEVGAEFVADVKDHKLMKTRMLNGTHIAMSTLAILAGYQKTDEAMRNEAIYDFVEKLMRDEVQPLLPAVPGMNTPEYRQSLLSRLSNPQMSDQLSRLARRGSEKIASFLMPSLLEAIEQDRPHTLLMLALAGWVRYLRGVDLKGLKIQIEDPQKELLTKLATMDGANPDALLRHEIFDEVRTVPGFMDRLREMILDIDEQGVIATLNQAMRDDERELVAI